MPHSRRSSRRRQESPVGRWDDDTPPPTPCARSDAQVGHLPATIQYHPPASSLLKLPEFWEAQPAAWFLHVESQFALRQITDDELRYHHVVAALPPSATARLVGVLSAPPAVGKYPSVKAELLYAFGLSDAERADRLFSLNGLGGRRPSEMMAHMLDLVGSRGPQFLLRQLFLRQLPPDVRASLATCGTENLVDLATEADKFFLESRAAGAGSARPLHASPSATEKRSADTNSKRVVPEPPALR